MLHGPFEILLEHGHNALCGSKIDVILQRELRANCLGEAGQNLLKENSICETNVNPLRQVADEFRGTHIFRIERIEKFAVGAKNLDAPTDRAGSESVSEWSQELVCDFHVQGSKGPFRNRLCFLIFSYLCQNKAVADRLSKDLADDRPIRTT